MIDDRNEAMMFIGLHKLAQQNGDGLVPELYELLVRSVPERDHDEGRGGQILKFPSARTRTPANRDHGDGGSAVIPLRRG